MPVGNVNVHNTRMSSCDVEIISNCRPTFIIKVLSWVRRGISDGGEVISNKLSTRKMIVMTPLAVNVIHMMKDTL